MSIVHHADKSLNLLRSTYQGVITMSDIVSSYRTLYSGGTYQPGMNELVDLLEADLGSISTDEVFVFGKQVEDRFRAWGKEIKVAVVAHKGVNHGMVRMYDSWALDSPQHIQLFDNQKSALEWLGLMSFDAAI